MENHAQEWKIIQLAHHISCANCMIFYSLRMGVESLTLWGVITDAFTSIGRRNGNYDDGNGATWI
jgi:hypothetical protein